MTLRNYRTLGRSGLVVSPLTLGTMTFGNDKWGSPDDASEAIFHAYVDAGGNSIDTADVYSGGKSEELVGKLIADRSLRDRLVLATKCGFNTDKQSAHGGGNGRKHIVQSVEASLKRLQTDRIDLYWIHVWDTVTPAEELLETLSGLTRAGKILHYGFSNLPAWFATRIASLAEAGHFPRPVALQLEYSLTERSIEREHIPAARALGLGLLPWSPLDGGFLSGKYRRENGKVEGTGRLSGANPFGDSKFSERNWNILDVLRNIASEMDRPMAQVALAWLLTKPGVSSPIVGVSKQEQLGDSIAALGIVFSEAQAKQLEDATAPELIYPYPIFTPAIINGLFGGNAVEGWKS